MARIDVAKAAPEVYRALGQVERAIRSGPLEAGVRELVKIRASQMNGCLFCTDMHIHEALEGGETLDRIHQLTGWRESELYTEAERAALAYTEAATRQPDEVPDETWAAVTAAYEPEQAAYLVAQVAMINNWNRLMAPMRIPPPRRTPK